MGCLKENDHAMDCISCRPGFRGDCFESDGKGEEIDILAGQLEFSAREFYRVGKELSAVALLLNCSPDRVAKNVEMLYRRANELVIENAQAMALVLSHEGHIESLNVQLQNVQADYGEAIHRAEAAEKE